MFIKNTKQAALIHVFKKYFSFFFEFFCFKEKGFIFAVRLTQ
jgi:hypothetical protein